MLPDYANAIDLKNIVKSESDKYIAPSNGFVHLHTSCNNQNGGAIRLIINSNSDLVAHGYTAINEEKTTIIPMSKGDCIQPIGFTGTYSIFSFYFIPCK